MSDQNSLKDVGVTKNANELKLEGIRGHLEWKKNVPDTTTDKFSESNASLYVK